nr:MAG TPA: hypothetical protein [Caudoviricetes sp.]
MLSIMLFVIIGFKLNIMNGLYLAIIIISLIFNIISIFFKIINFVLKQQLR